MSRAKYNPWEVDQNFQIEEGIRDALRQSSTAKVSASVIQNAYELLDLELNPIAGSLAEKCETLAYVVGANFFLAGVNVVFKKPVGI